MSPERGDTLPKNEVVVESRNIDRLCLAVKIPGYKRGSVLFVGWDKNGNPTTSTDQSSLSEQARTSYGITKAVSFPHDRDLASLPLVPVEFVGASKPFDRKDISDDELTQDILTYWVSRGGGATEQIQVQELDLLEGILNGQVVWEDFNEHALVSDSDEKITGQNMYTLFLPLKSQDGEQAMYLMMFKPPMKNESNESMYKQFLVQTLTALAKIDKDQPEEHRKGYLEAIGLEDVESGKAVEGGVLAVGILDIMRRTMPGIFYLSDARMDQISRDSAGKSIATQVKIILREFGLYNLASVPRTTADLDSYSTEALLTVVAAAYHLAERSIRG